MYYAQNQATSSTSMIFNKWQWPDAEICLLQSMASGRSGPSGQNATPAVEEAPDNATGPAQAPSSVGRSALAKRSKLRPVTHRTVPVSSLFNLLVWLLSILSMRFKSAVPNDWLAICRSLKFDDYIIREPEEGMRHEHEPGDNARVDTHGQLTPLWTCGCIFELHWSILQTEIGRAPENVKP